MTFTLAPKQESRWANFDDTKRYRYSLRICWNDSLPMLGVIGLNPSTADGQKDDATVRRWKGYAKDWGFGGLMIVNLCALVSTDPKRLSKSNDPYGPLNSVSFIKSTMVNAGCRTVWACWGNVPKMVKLREHQVEQEFRKLWCIGVTKSGYPCHPLRKPKTAKLKPWNFSE